MNQTGYVPESLTESDGVMKTLSFVMANHNYAHFVAQSVQSALDVDWPDVEVVVVDDGSTDSSLDVLATFGDKITVIAQEKAGQRVASNRGFAATHGDAVIFLDTDDLVEPSIAREAAAVWRPGISKVQVQMQRIDSQSRCVGRRFPKFPPDLRPDQIRRWILQTGAYPTPPNSGNVWARSYLERLFPLDNSCGEQPDSALLAAAPFLGDVVTVAKPLVRYRIHDSNVSKLNDPAVYFRQIERAYLRQRFAMRMAGRPHERDDVMPSLRRGRHLLQLRVAESRLHGEGPLPVPADTRTKMLVDSLVSPFAPGPEPAWERLVGSLWCVGTLLAPEPLARRLIKSRFG